MTTVHCDVCGQDNAYYNGVCYECPDCGNEWGENEYEESDDDSEEYY